MKKALVIAFTLLLGLGIAAFAGPLSGSWSSSLTLQITPPVAPATVGTIVVSAFTSTLVVDYTVGGWTFESTTGFTLTGWTTQKFTADGTLGAFTLGSTLVFAPASAAFTSWDNTASVSIAGVDLSGEFKLTSSGSGWNFGASGVAGDLSLGATAYFNMDSSGDVSSGYCFCFSSVEITADFPFACIDNVNATIAFSNTGFDGVTFKATGIAVPSIAWLTFDASVTFDDQTYGKTLTITPNINLGDFSCITLYYSLDYTADAGSPSTALDITGIKFYGIGLEHTFNGVTFSSLSYFDGTHYVKTDTEYWEVFTIKSAGDSCCGGAVDFSIDTYFDASSALLFDWGETDVSLSFGIGSNFTINTGLIVNTSGLTQVSFGFDVTW